MKTIFRTALLVSMMSAFSSQATAQETNQVNTKTIRCDVRRCCYDVFIRS